MLMFNKEKPNIIILTDFTNTLFLERVLGATKVADSLRQEGYEVLVINHLHTFSVDEIIDILKKTINSNTLFVGFNSIFYQFISQPSTSNEKEFWANNGIKFSERELGAFLPHGKKFNKEIRSIVNKINPKCKLVLGGPDAIDREWNSDYDYVILGLADTSAVNLAQHLEHGKELKKARKSLYKFTVIDDSKALEYNFVNTQMYYSNLDIVMPNETLPIEIARGCIFNCKFCSYPLNGKKKNDYVKCEDVLYNELMSNFEQFGTTRYIFTDDTFNDTKLKLETVYRISKKLPFKLEYWATSRLDLLTAHPDTIELLYDSGCRASYFGVESLNRNAAAAIGKGGNRENLINTLKYIKNKYGESVSLHGSFIFGLPHEDKESFKRTSDQLLSGETYLDSWGVQPLMLRPADGLAFSSELDRNYKKYGYEIAGYDAENDFLLWKNEFTTFEECKEIASELQKNGISSGKVKVRGDDSFYISTLGFDLDYSLNKPISEFNWNSVELKKSEYIKIYKKLLTRAICGPE